MNWTEAEYNAYLLRQGALPTPLAETTPEGTLLAQVRHLAMQHGFMSYHTHDSRRSEPGFPDLVLCNGVRLLIYELKTNTGKVTAEQERWLSLLAHTGTVESGVWRPKDWPAIQATLTRKDV